MKMIDIFSIYISTPRWLNLAPSSKRLYMNAFKSMVEFMDRDIKTITRGELLDYLNTFGTRSGMARHAMNVLRNLYKIACDRGIIQHNLTHNIDMFGEYREIERWEDDEVDLFLSQAKPHLRSAMLLALYTGQRNSDLVRMQWSDYDGNYIKVTQKKTGTRLVIPVHPKLRADLELRREMPQPKRRRYRTPYLISNYYGYAWSPGALRKAIVDEARRLGIKKMFHGIRKTTASILAESGCSANQIMAITGHKTLSEVQRYTLRANQKKMADEAMKAWENNHG